MTFEEVNELLPPEVIAPEAIDGIIGLLGENEVEVLDSAKKPKDEESEDESDEAPLGIAPVVAAEGEEVAATPDIARGETPLNFI